MIFGKRGLSGSFRIMVLMILLGAIFSYLMIFSDMLVIDSIDTSEIEYSILFNSFLYSPDSFMYFDEDINRYYPGIIDLDLFNEKTISKSIRYNHNFSAFKFTITNFNSGEKKEAYYNKDQYDLYRNFASLSNDYYSKTEDFLVKIYDRKNDEFYNGKLEMDMVVFDGN